MNKHIKPVLISHLLKWNIQIPNLQRIVDKKKVEEIVKYQLDYIRKNRYHNFLGTLNIQYLRPSNSYYLIDGQHRYEAMKKLFHDFSHDYEYYIEKVDIEDEKQLKENYELINKNTPLPELEANFNKNIVEKTCNYFQETYPQIWSKTSRARRPLIFFNYFQESLAFIQVHLRDKITNPGDLIDIIELKNQELSKWETENFPSINDRMLSKAHEYNFFLGLYQHISNEEYGYEWVKDIIKQYTGKDIQKRKKRPRKQQIPKKVKSDAWDKYIGEDIAVAKCIVCCHTTINAKDFEAGHIISEKNGGPVNIDNILPICSACNRSMAAMDMNEYIKEKYPSNFEDFSKRYYKIVPVSKTYQ